TLVLLFGMWVLFAGIMRTIGAFTAKQNNVQGWGWILTIGIIGIIVGFIALFNPVVSAIGIVLVVAIFFIVQGIGAIATFFFIGKNS
ncbi:HdeD family acid-resistance protein, partial [Listeria monocytogenes]|nr:HdeD family acid-resistance protein [Listeria monocytogenes]